MPTVSAGDSIRSRASSVWEVLSDFGGIEKWSPVVVRSVSTTAANQGVGAARHCDLFPRGSVEEQIVEWDPEARLGINVDPAGPIRAQRSDFHIAADGGGTRVTMAIAFELHSEATDRLEAIESALRAAAEGSIAGLKYYVETGEVVGTQVPKRD